MISRYILFIAVCISSIAYAVNSQDRTVGNNLDFQETNSIKRLKELGLKKLTSGSTPPAGSVNVYVKTDGNVYKKDESGTESQLGGGDGGAGGVVINKNPGFEQGTLNWTASGGSFATTTESSNVGFGSIAGSWDSSASGQTLSGDLVTIPAGLYGKICTLSFYYKGGDPNIKAQVFDGTNIIAESSALSEQSIYSSKQVLYFTCPSSGSIAARFYSSGDAAVIYLDEVRLGQETLFHGKEELIGGFNTTSSASMSLGAINTWVTFSNSSFSSKTFHGKGEAPSNNNHFAFKLKNIPAGDIEVCTSTVIQSLSGDLCYGAIYDGSTRAGITLADSNAGSVRDNNKIACATFSYSSPQVEREFSIQGYGTGATNCTLRANNPTGAELSGITAKLIRSSNNTQAVSVDKLGWRIDANIGGASNISLGVGNVSSYTEITNPGLDMVLFPGSASAEIPCSGTNTSSGLTCSSGDESVGISFIPPSTGKYEACFDFEHVVGGTTYQIITAHQVVETPNNAQTILQEGGARIANSGDLVSSSTQRISSQKHICGIFTFNSVSKKTLRLMYEQSVSGSPSTSSISADRSSSIGQRDIKVSVRRLVEFQDAVKFTNLVTTSKTEGIKLEAARIENSGTASVIQQTGFIQNVSTPSTGRINVDFVSGKFSSTPACTCTGESAVYCYIDASLGHSTTGTTIRTLTDSNVNQNSNVSLYCIGF